MSERMNKERAKHIETLKAMRDNYKMDLQDTRVIHWTDNKTQYDKRVELLTDSIQALDIAIDSLDNEWVDVRDRLPEESGYYFVTRDKEGWGVFGNEVHKNFFNGEKWLVDFNGTDITHQVIAWKKVEPYERKE